MYGSSCPPVLPEVWRRVFVGNVNSPAVLRQARQPVRVPSGLFRAGVILSACILWVGLTTPVLPQEKEPEPPAQEKEPQTPAQEKDSQPPADDTSVDKPLDKSVEKLDAPEEGAELPDMPAEEAIKPGTARAPGYQPLAGLNYAIGPEDVLEIDVFNVPELHKMVRVSNDGSIGVPLLGYVTAAGFTTDQLQKDLEEKYGATLLQDPQVSVYVREYHAQPVSVIGAVERPGLYHLTAPRSLIEVLSMAGGLAKRTSAPAGSSLFVSRKGGFGDLAPVEGMQQLSPEKIEINISRLLYSEDAALNIEIQPRDTISIAKADVVYVVGDVKKPGGFVLEAQENLTVLQALALAEGTLNTAAKSQARIIRKAADGSRAEVPVDLKKVLAGKSPDLVLAANDILFVPNSAAKTAIKRGAEATIGTISGILIYRRP